MVTRGKKAGHWRHVIAEQLFVELQFDRALFGTPITPERPAVEFGPGVVESLQSKVTTLELLNRAQAVSAQTKVKILHPEWRRQAIGALGAAGEQAPVEGGIAGAQRAQGQQILLVSSDTEVHQGVLLLVAPGSSKYEALLGPLPSWRTQPPCGQEGRRRAGSSALPPLFHTGEDFGELGGTTRRRNRFPSGP